jgi:hypothetical protein
VSAHDNGADTSPIHQLTDALGLGSTIWHTAERTTLNLDQAQALHQALYDYQHNGSSPACPTCGSAPEAITIQDSWVTLHTNVDFTPCGHGFTISDNTLHALWNRSEETTA